MLRNILPEAIYECFKSVDFNKVSEIRLRVGCPIMVVANKNYYLCSDGLTLNKEVGICVRKKLIDDILQLVSNNSLYAINDQLIQGYVTFEGIRIGVSGEVVIVDNEIKTIKNINSLNLRIPHIVKNCSLPVYNYLVNSRPYNTLIISPPGAGKTTFLRDFMCQINERNHALNLLVVDERSEIMATQCDNALSVDVYKNCSKDFAFTNGIRSMKPDVILTDEINLDMDVDAIENAITSGVKVIATIHASSINDLKNKRAFQNIINKQLFDRYVVLGFSNGVGTIEGVFNETFRCIYV